MLLRWRKRGIVLQTGSHMSVSSSSTLAPDDGRPGPRISQTQWVLVSMVVGIALGYFFPDGPGTTGFHATDLQVLSNVFLRMIKSLIAPLLFGTLVYGVAGLGKDVHRRRDMQDTVRTGYNDRALRFRRPAQGPHAAPEVRLRHVRPGLQRFQEAQLTLVDIEHAAATGADHGFRSIRGPQVQGAAAAVMLK